MKIFTKKLQKVVCFGLSLGVMAGLMAVPGYRVHADETSEISNENEVVYTENEINTEDTEITENTESGLIVVTEAATAAEEASEVTENFFISMSNDALTFKSESVKRSLEEKLKGVTGTLYSGVTRITLSDCGKRVVGFIGAFSDGYKEFEKVQAKKQSAQRSESLVSDRKTSDELPYKHNPDMVKDVTNKEYDILCRIVEAEAGDQDVYGRILVANVVLNRVNYTKEFANDIEGVVFEKGQFSPISNGAYYRVEVDDITREAVTRALEGEDYSAGALYFIQRSSASKSGSAWFDTLTFLFKYGCHEFYVE